MNDISCQFHSSGNRPDIITKINGKQLKNNFTKYFFFPFSVLEEVNK